jgi:hypothetical protein
LRFVEQVAVTKKRVRKRSRGRCAKDLRGRDGDAYNAGA